MTLWKRFLITNLKVHTGKVCWRFFCKELEINPFHTFKFKHKIIDRTGGFDYFIASDHTTAFLQGIRNENEGKHFRPL